MDKFNLVAVLLIVLLLVVVCGPMILIWAVNALGGAAVAGFAIPYTLKTWFAALMIMFLLGGSTSASKK